LPFAECLTADAIKEQLKELGLPGREQIYSHCTTLLPLHHSTPTAPRCGSFSRRCSGKIIPVAMLSHGCWPGESDGA
jgi:hypothetical protein